MIVVVIPGELIPAWHRWIWNGLSCAVYPYIFHQIYHMYTCVLSSLAAVLGAGVHLAPSLPAWAGTHCMLRIRQAWPAPMSWWRASCMRSSPAAHPATSSRPTPVGPSRTHPLSPRPLPAHRCSAGIREARETGTQTSLRTLRNFTLSFWTFFPCVWVLVQVGWDGGQDDGVVAWGRAVRAAHTHPLCSDAVLLA